MTTKVVYFTVGGKPEQAEFSSDFPADDIKGTSISVCVCALLEHSGCPSFCKPLLKLYIHVFCFVLVL